MNYNLSPASRQNKAKLTANIRLIYLIFYLILGSLTGIGGCSELDRTDRTGRRFIVLTERKLRILLL